MATVLLKLFVKDYENVSDDQVRKNYGFLSGFVGIFCNILLFAVKYVMGILSGSVSIISDAFNNLSDSGSCILTLFGYKMAAKPADKDHPFGHGRMEYLFSLIVATIIMLVGFELLKNSINKIMHPQAVTFSIVALLALIASILVKLWLSHFNNVLGTKINSLVMLATAKDSRNDVITTVASIVALVASLYTKAPVDGIIGCGVSLFVMFAGFGIIKDTVDELLGKPADKEIVSSIEEILLDEEIILGVHDMLIHSYGPGVTFGSIHVEVDCRNDIMLVHDKIDMLEKNVYDKLGVVLTIHMDPIDTEDETINEKRTMISKIINDISPKLSFHDFRMVKGPTHTNLIFDVVVPFDCDIKSSLIKEMIDEALEKENENYYTVVSIDRDYT